MSFVNRRYTKREPFLLKMPCTRITGGGKVGGPSSYKTLLSAPLAHWAIITSCSEKLCVLLLLFIVTFYAFRFFSYSIAMVLFSLHVSPLPLFRLYKFHHFSCDTSHVSFRPIKTFLYDKLTRKLFPWTLVGWWGGICPISGGICKLLAVFISLAIMAD